MRLGVESGSSYRSIESSTIRGHPNVIWWFFFFFFISQCEFFSNIVQPLLPSSVLLPSYFCLSICLSILMFLSSFLTTFSLFFLIFLCFPFVCIFLSYFSFFFLFVTLFSFLSHCVYWLLSISADYIRCDLLLLESNNDYHIGAGSEELCFLFSNCVAVCSLIAIIFPSFFSPKPRNK